MKCTQLYHYTKSLLFMNFRVQFEDKVKTTEHSVKEICKKYGYVTTKSSFPSVIIALAIVSAIVTPLLISCIFIFCKRYGLCDHLRNGKSLSNIPNSAIAIQMLDFLYNNNLLVQVVKCA